MKKTIMIIGAGLLQLPAIRIAKEMGLRTLVTDFNPNTIGMQLADIPVIMSTKDIEGNVRIAKQYSQYINIDGVITVGTDASMTVSAVANALNLPGLKYEVAERASNKLKMREAFKKHKVPSPKFYSVWNKMELYKYSEKLGYPLVIKPVDNMGARGVKKINNKDELEMGFKEAKTASPSGEIIIENYMEGPELSIDMLLWNYKPIMIGIADRIITNEPYFIEIGHDLPSRLDKKYIDDAIKVMIKGAKALGIDTGAAKGDIKITKDGAKIGELAARLSGGFMSAFTFPLATGLDIIKTAIEIALGHKPKKIKQQPLNKFSLERAIIPSPGRILKMDNIETAKNIKNVKEIIMKVNEGDVIVSPKSNMDKAGNIIAVADSYEEALYAVETALKTIHIEIGPVNGLNLETVYNLARKKMYSVCKVCADCNGLKCIGEMPGMGSVGTGQTFKNNIEFLRKISLNINLIKKEDKPDLINTSISLLNKTFKSPIFLAPITGAQTNLDNCISEKQLTEIMVKGGIENGSISFVGDGASSDKYKIILNTVKENNGWAIPIFKPRTNNNEIYKRIETALLAGCDIIGLDIDAVSLNTMNLKNQATSRKSINELKTIKKKFPIKLILKGILSEEDTKLALDCGADCIVVSNHGGRTLDFLPASIQVLPSISKIINNKIPILIDGGFRNGTDILKAIALGANGVLIGRPFVICSVGAGVDGINLYFNKLKKELIKAMLITGCSEISDITKSVIYDS